jgi:hypothetical protein
VCKKVGGWKDKRDWWQIEGIIVKRLIIIRNRESYENSNKWFRRLYRGYRNVWWFGRREEIILEI